MQGLLSKTITPDPARVLRGKNAKAKDGETSEPVGAYATHFADEACQFTKSLSLLSNRLRLLSKPCLLSAQFQYQVRIRLISILENAKLL